MILHIADGAKGGVGKSIVAQILINYLSRNNSISVFETDTQIPDVAKSVEKTGRDINLVYADLRTDDGWQTMLETLQELSLNDSTKNQHVVMSLPGADLNIRHYTELVASLCEPLGIEVWDWFSMNNLDVSVGELKDSLAHGFASIAAKRIAIKNGGFGREESFVAYDRERELRKKCVTIYIPGLTMNAFAAYRKNERVTIDEAAANAMDRTNGKKPDVLYSSNLTNWVKKIDQVLGVVFEVSHA